ncbi:unnamed protein product [Ilex paraguariensis]|uniref:Uncharacterized protein n=1 Tax=Ilex paraguariensis TaxID=185542 RepID=A0ABC8SGJ9_9AQUA
MKECSTETVTTPPKVQKLERLQTIEKEHKDALKRAVTLNIPHAVTTPEEEPSGDIEVESTSGQKDVGPSQNEGKEASTAKTKPCDARTNWNHVVEKLFKRNGSGELLLKRDEISPR